RGPYRPSDLAAVARDRTRAPDRAPPHGSDGPNRSHGTARVQLLGLARTASASRSEKTQEPMDDEHRTIGAGGRSGPVLRSRRVSSARMGRPRHYRGGGRPDDTRGTAAGPRRFPGAVE